MGESWYKGRFGMSRVKNNLYNIFGDEYKLYIYYY